MAKRNRKKLLTLNAFTRANLEFPLGGHNLSVGSRNLDTSVQASLVVGLNDVSAENLSSTNTTVVWALRTWETVYGPSIRSVGHVKKGVLLLKTEPWLVSLVGLHELGTLVAVVELVWCSVGVPALTDNQDVWVSSEWVGEDCNWSEVDIGVVARSLASGATVEVPLWEVVDGKLAALWDLGEGLRSKLVSQETLEEFSLRLGMRLTHLGLGADATESVDPDVPFA